MLRVSTRLNCTYEHIRLVPTQGECSLSCGILQSPLRLLHSAMAPRCVTEPQDLYNKLKAGQQQTLSANATKTCSLTAMHIILTLLGEKENIAHLPLRLARIEVSEAFVNFGAQRARVGGGKGTRSPASKSIGLYSSFTESCMRGLFLKRLT